MSEKELPTTRAPKKGVVDLLLNLDHRKATKFLIWGMVIAIIFGAIALTSKSIAANANDWYYWQYHIYESSLNKGQITNVEFTKLVIEIDISRYWMQYQEVIFGNIARIGVDFGLILVFIGFIAYTGNKDLNDKIRLLSLILAGIVITVIMFTSLFTGISVTMV